MNKFVLFAIVIIACIIGGYYVSSFYCSSLNDDLSKIESPSPSYLIWDPTYLGGEQTKIFLISTENPRYDHYSGNDEVWSDGEIHNGDPCFVFSVTIRNDYTTDPIWIDEDSPAGLYYKYVKLSIHIYDQFGRVKSFDVTPPINSLHGGHVITIEPQETTTIDVFMATSNRELTRYEVYIEYLGALPEP